MVLKSNSQQFQFNSRAYQQLQNSLDKLQGGKRISAGKMPTQQQSDAASTPSARSQDAVEISPEAVAKAQRLSQSNPSNTLTQPDQASETGNANYADILAKISQAILRRQVQGGSSTQTEETPTSSDAAPAETETPAETAAVEATAPATPTSAQLGAVSVTNIQGTTDADGNLTGGTGEIDLTSYGLGKVAVDLTVEGGQIVGATSQEDSFSIDVGGNTFTVGATQGEDVFSVDAQGNIAVSGNATANIGNQQIEIGNASIEIGQDAEGNNVISIDGEYSPLGQGSGAQVSVEYNSSGTVNAEASYDIIGDLVPGFDQVTGFLDRVGVDVGTGGGASLSFDRGEGSFAVEALGYSGSYNQTTGEFSIGGLEVDVGVSVALENLTINTKTGAVSGEVTAGVGVGVGDVGVGIDLAGFSFDYDPTDDGITLTGTQGIAAANVEATVKLGRGSDGQYGVESVTFRANIDTELARDVAAGLNTAYEAGTEAGSRAVEEFGRVAQQGNAAVQDFAEGLNQAGADVGGFLDQTARMTGDNLNNFLSAASSAGDNFSDFVGQTAQMSGTNLNRFLSTASSAGSNLGGFLDQAASLSGTNLNNFLSSASNAGNQLGSLLTTAGELTDSNLSNFLSAAANKGSGVGSFVSDFRSLLNDVNRVSGGVASLSVSRSGGISGKINAPGVGSMNVSFGRENGKLSATGTLNLGGFAFGGAKLTFNSQGRVSSVEGEANISTPKFKVLGKKIGSKKLGFDLQLDSQGNINASAKLSVNLGFLGKHGARFTLGSGGFSTKTF